MLLFNVEEVLALRQTTKLVGHPFSAAHDCLLDIVATTIHICIYATCRGDK